VAPGVALDAPALGRGDPVVLLPGFGSDVAVFARQTPLLAESFRAIGVNPRGVAASDAPEAEAYGVAQMAADAARCFDGAAHVVGASLGAAAAIELALAQPGRVHSLVLITPFATASPRLLAVLDAWIAAARALPPAVLAEVLLPWLFGDATLLDDRARRRIGRGLAEIAARVPAPTLARQAAGLRAWSGTRAAGLARLAPPTLVIAGGADLLTPDAAEVAAAIPGARLVAAPGAGHAVALEAPEVVNEAILAHLRSCAP
jgi:pimeloyl-ACP methyl ester carboxylesterase